jgi:hypothetical protein
MYPLAWYVASENVLEEVEAIEVEYRPGIPGVCDLTDDKASVLTELHEAAGGVVAMTNEEPGRIGDRG